jgi:catechol 2,3-dioxygenase-like lactoylglutathione lyase family enzyme
MSDRFDHLYIEPADFDASLRFYREILGWRVVTEWKNTGGSRGVQLSGGGIRLVLAEPANHPATSDAPTPGSHAPVIHLDIHDADSRFAQIPPGSHVVTAPEDNHWGTRWFVVRDPDGNRLAFNERRQKASK